MECCSEWACFRHRGTKANNEEAEYSLGESDKNTILCHLQMNMGISYKKLTICTQNKDRMGDNMPFIGYKNRWLCFPVFIEIILVWN